MLIVTISDCALCSLLTCLIPSVPIIRGVFLAHHSRQIPRFPAIDSPVSGCVKCILPKGFWVLLPASWWVWVLCLAMIPRRCVHQRKSAARSSSKNGRPGLIRTGDPLLRRQMLYPTELRARAINFNSIQENSPSRNARTLLLNVYFSLNNTAIFNKNIRNTTKFSTPKSLYC